MLFIENPYCLYAYGFRNYVMESIECCTGVAVIKCHCTKETLTPMNRYKEKNDV